MPDLKANQLIQTALGTSEEKGNSSTLKVEIEAVDNTFGDISKPTIGLRKDKEELQRITRMVENLRVTKGTIVGQKAYTKIIEEHF